MVICDIAVSLDGFSPGQPDPRGPLGEGGEELHRWMFEHPDANAAEMDAITDAGAFIMGRNMFGPTAAAGTSTGRAGGATTRRTTRRCSCSPTTRASR